MLSVPLWFAELCLLRVVWHFCLDGPPAVNNVVICVSFIWHVWSPLRLLSFPGKPRLSHAAEVPDYLNYLGEPLTVAFPLTTFPAPQMNVLTFTGRMTNSSDEEVRPAREDMFSIYCPPTGSTPLAFTICTLTINNVTERDMGFYNITFRNGWGKAVFRFQLDINGISKPHPSLSVSVSLCLSHTHSLWLERTIYNFTTDNATERDKGCARSHLETTLEMLSSSFNFTSIGPVSHNLCVCMSVLAFVSVSPYTPTPLFDVTGYTFV